MRGCLPADDQPVTAHGVTWLPVQRVAVDLAADRPAKSTTFRWESITTKPVAEREPIDYIKLMMFSDLSVFLERANKVMASDPHAPCSSFTHTKAINEEEFYVYLSMKLLMDVDNVGAISSYWAEAFDDDNPCLLPRSYGKRFKISKHRFEAIDRNMIWHDATEVRCPLVGLSVLPAARAGDSPLRL